MRKVLISISMLTLLFSIIGYTDSLAQKKQELKEHVCTEECKTGHIYKHGEKGHICGAECETSIQKASNSELKEHVCTEECKNGHVYKHGEKGHVCGAECKNK